MQDFTTGELVIWMILALAGVIIHFAKQFQAAKKNGVGIDPFEYWRGHPYESIICVVGTVAIFAVAIGTGQMNVAMAFSSGFMGNSAADIVGRRAQSLQV